MGLSTIWPPTLVVVVISFVYGTFMYSTLLPQLSRAYDLKLSVAEGDPSDYVPSKTEILTIIISYHILFFMLWLSFVRSALTVPGHIPRNEVCVVWILSVVECGVVRVLGTLSIYWLWNGFFSHEVGFPFHFGFGFSALAVLMDFILFLW